MRPGKSEFNNAVERPFKVPHIRSFFEKWTEANLMGLRVISKDELGRVEGESEGLRRSFDEKEGWKSELTISEELCLSEIGYLVRVINKETFGEQSERGKKEEKKLDTLVRNYKNSGIYLASRLDSIDEGRPREFAEKLALEYYNYGDFKSILGQRYGVLLNSGDIPSKDLSLEETVGVDRFFAGNVFHDMLQKNFKETSGLEPEAIRIKTLNEFFKKASSNKVFFEDAQEAITRNIETPRRMLATAIYRHGVEEVLSKLKVRRKSEMSGSEKVLVDALEIPLLREELNKVRSEGDPDNISRKEQEIASVIQDTVSKFPYKEDVINLAAILKHASVNCTTASLIGSYLLGEAGLNHAVGTARPAHSVLLLVLSNGKVEWRDMQVESSHMNANKYLTEIIVEGEDSQIVNSSVVGLSGNLDFKGLSFDINHSGNPNYKHMSVSAPEVGNQSELLMNFASSFIFKHKRFDEAIVALEDVIAINPNYAPTLYKLGVYADFFFKRGNFLAKFGFFYREANMLLLEAERLRRKSERNISGGNNLG